MDRIEDFQAFVAIIEKGSLTGAARHLNRSLQSISRSLAAVERDLGVELIRRTTRRSSPSEAGLAFYRRLNAALAEIEAAKAQASNRRAEPSGTLRVAGSSMFGAFYLVPAIAAFLDIHPRLNIELDLSDRAVDLLDEGFDLAIRSGNLPDSSLKARRLIDLRFVVFAAPAGRSRAPSVHHPYACRRRLGVQDRPCHQAHQGRRAPAHQRDARSERGSRARMWNRECTAVAGQETGRPGPA